MSHLIPEHAIERLASLNGVPGYQAWLADVEDCEARMAAQLAGTFEDDWQSCLPTWLKLGRVNDRSRGIKAPHYFLSYATILGCRFAARHRDSYPSLIQLMRNEPVDSTEYLCAFDLLAKTALEFADECGHVPEELYSLSLPIPAVVVVENRWDDNCRAMTSVGQMIEYLTEENRLGPPDDE